MLRIGALNDDTSSISEPETSVGIRREAQENEGLTLYNKALSFQKSGDRPQAEKLYNQILKSQLITETPDPSQLDPDEIVSHSGLLLKYTVYKNLGDIAHNTEDYEKALDHYLEAALVDESDVSLWWRVGQIALKVTNITLARFAFEKGLYYNENHWPCLDHLVTVLYVIGDYSVCLEWIAKGLERDDMFIKGLAIRDQIFKEESHFRNDFQDYKILFYTDTENRVSKSEDEYQKYIEEALLMKEKRLHLAKREKLPKIKLTKHMQYYTWSCLGDCLVQLYDELTDPDSLKSLCWPIDLERYQRNPEQKGVLTVPSPELIARKNTKMSIKDSYDKRGIKRKKTTLFEKDIDPIPKRRSTRVKSSKQKEEDVNWNELLFSFLPEFLRSESGGENEDSQDSMSEDIDTVSNQENTDSRGQIMKEARQVSKFINTNVRNSGCIDIASNLIWQVSYECPPFRSPGIPSMFAKLYKRIRKHLHFPPMFCRDTEDNVILDFAKVVLLALEIQLDEWLSVRSKVSHSLSPAQSPLKSGKKTDSGSDSVKLKGSHEFLCDMHYLVFLTSCQDILKDFWAEFNIRLYWLQARYFMLMGDNDNSLNSFDNSIAALMPGNGFVDKDVTIRLHHCQVDNVITLGNVKKKLDSLQRCQSLEEVNKLYEAGSYTEVVHLLTPLLKQETLESKGEDVSVSSPERPTQLLLLQESLLKLRNYKKCIICSEFALQEAIMRMTPCDAWKTTLERLFDCLNRCLNEDSAVFDVVAKETRIRLIQNLIKIIENSLEAFDTPEPLLSTAMPWLLLYRIVKHFDAADADLNSDDNQKDMNTSAGSNSADNDLRLYASLQFIKNAHEQLGRRAWCCDDQGVLLLQFVKDLKQELQKSMPPTEREEITREIEQCFLCLYGHPSKKTKNRKLQDHSTTQIPLTWEYAQIVYDFFKPTGLPELHGNKIHTLTLEAQNLMKRIVAVVPQKEVEVISFDNLQAYIDGLGELPKDENWNARRESAAISDLFYYLGDFHFKNKEFNKAIKFYMHDVCLNPDRFGSWAAMALARGARLQDKINACEPKSDGPLKKHIISTLRCYETATVINNKNCMIWEEYGSTAYMLNSNASRRLREHIQDEEFTPDTQTMLSNKRKEMINLAEKCFVQANNCIKKDEEGDPWLHSYMLGKTAEKLHKSPEIYLECYQSALEELDIAGATYLKKLPYHGSPDYSIEALEIYYRLHSSVLKVLERADGEIDYNFLENHLDRVSRTPFHLTSISKGPERTISKEETGTANISPNQSTNITKCNLETTAKATVKPQAESFPQSCSKESAKLSVDQPLPENLWQLSTSIANTDTVDYSNVSEAMNVDTKSSQETEFTKMDTDSDVSIFEYKDNKLPTEVTESSKVNGVDTERSVKDWSQFSNSEGEKDSHIQEGCNAKESTTVDGKEVLLKTIGGNEKCGIRSEKSNTPDKIYCKNRSFASTKEKDHYIRIVDRCLKAFSFCLKRFPEHYKSQYKTIYVLTYYPTHKDLAWSRDLLLGSNSPTNRPITLPIHGLFSDKSKNNLFQHLWRIPIDEIDRPGSFCSHICRAIEILLQVLSELKEWDTLLIISSKLHRTPDRDKKYLRDNDRAFLAIKGFDLAIAILKSKLKSSANFTMKEKRQVLMDSYEAYKHAQKMQISTQMTEHLLVRAYSILQVKNTGETGSTSSLVESDYILLDRALRSCQIRMLDTPKKQPLTPGAPNIASVNVLEYKSDKPSLHGDKQSSTQEQIFFM